MAAKKKFSDTFSASGGTDEDKQKRFAAGGLIAMGAFLAGGIFQILWMNAITMKLGKQDMGLFGPLLFAFYAAGTVIALGVPQTITTFVSLHYENEFEESRKFITDGMRLLCLSAISVLLIGCVIPIILVLTGALSTINAALIIAFIVSISMMAMFWGINSILNGFQRLDLVSVGNIVFPIVQYGASLVLIIVAQKITGAEKRWDVVGSVLGLGLGQGAAGIAALIVLTANKTVSIKELFGFKSSHGLFVKILKFGGWAAAALVIMTLIQNLPSVVVRLIGMKWLLFNSDPVLCEGEIGLFSTSMIFGMATMLIVGIAMAIIPAISEAEGQGRHDMMQKYYNTGFSQAFVILVAFIAVFAAVIGPLIEIMSGPEYPASVMGILGTLAVIGGAGCGALYLLINIFIGLKKPQVPAVVLFIVITLMFVLITGLSFAFKKVVWAAIGFDIATWLGAIIMFAWAKKTFKLNFPTRALLEPVAAAAIPLAVVLTVLKKPTDLWIKVSDNAVAGATKFYVNGILGYYKIDTSQLWKVGAALLIILVPYALIMVLLGKRKQKDQPENG